MAAAAEHAFNTPFFTRLVLVTAKLFAAYSAINDLFFSKEVQVKLLDISAHTKMYILLFVHERCALCLVSAIYVIRIHKKILIFSVNQKTYEKSNAF
jgi:hypothetical protein